MSTGISLLYGRSHLKFRLPRSPTSGISAYRVLTASQQQAITEHRCCSLRELLRRRHRLTIRRLTRKRKPTDLSRHGPSRLKLAFPSAIAIEAESLPTLQGTSCLSMKIGGSLAPL